jgi:alkylation response protein AidB-like acyl-CoA dehydrogenase
VGILVSEGFARRHGMRPPVRIAAQAMTTDSPSTFEAHDMMPTGAMDATTASSAKWWTTEMQCQVVDECLQLVGGYGYMLEYPIAQMAADSRVQKTCGSTNEIMTELIVRSL